MMTYKTDLQFEALIAIKTLHKFKEGDCEKKAEAARKILEDGKLFIQFIQVRLDRKNEKFSPTEEKKLTWWENCVNLVCRKA